MKLNMGLHEICFDNSNASKDKKLVSFNMKQHQSEYRKEETNEKIDENDIQSLINVAQSINTQFETIYKLQQYHRARLNRHLFSFCFRTHTHIFHTHTNFYFFFLFFFLLCFYFFFLLLIVYYAQKQMHIHTNSPGFFECKGRHMVNSTNYNIDFNGCSTRYIYSFVVFKCKQTI